jgi:hypothetical protein
MLPSKSVRFPHQENEKDPMFVLTTLAAVMQPRKSGHRSTSIALAVVVILSFYLFCTANPALALAPFAIRRPVPAPDSGYRPALLASYHRTKAAEFSASRPKIALDLPQELAAVTSFLASHIQNVIPPDLDPSVPMDPDVVLDFDTRGPRAAEELQVMVEDVWAQNPVVLYAKACLRFFQCSCPEIFTDARAAVIFTCLARDQVSARGHAFASTTHNLRR